MGTVMLSAPVRWWRCPSCRITARTEKAGVFTEFHACRALGSINLPMLEVQHPDDEPDGCHVLVMREDYALHPDDGPIAAINTVHGDGAQDCTVLAPVARVTIEQH